MPKFLDDIIIDGGAKLGVGVTSPNSALHISGSLDMRGNTDQEQDTNQLYLNANNGDGAGTSNDLGPGITWKPYYNTYSKRSAGILQIGEGNYFRSGLAFYTNNATDTTTDWSERMRISMDGKVGIGTAIPAEKVHVDFVSASDKFLLTRSGSNKAYIDGYGNGVFYGGLTSYSNSLAGGGGTFTYRGGSADYASIGHRFIHSAGAFAKTSGDQTMMMVEPTINQSSTAGYTGVKVNVTETATGSGTKNLLDLQVGGTSKASISNTGNATFAGDIEAVNGNVTGKFAVKSTGVHGSFDFYNNGTSYLNGATTVNDNLVVDGGDIKIQKNTPLLEIGTINTSTGNAKIQMYSKNTSSNGFAIEYNKNGSGAGEDQLEFIDGSGSARFKFYNGGSAWIASNFYMAPTKRLYLDDGSNTYITESSSDNISFVTGANVRLSVNNNNTIINGTLQGGNVFAKGVYCGGSNTSNGFLIETNISTTAYAMMHGTIKLEQFNFNTFQTIEFSATTQQNGTVVSKAGKATTSVTIKLFNYNSKWYVWVPQPSSYTTCTAFIGLAYSYQGQEESFNEVEDVSHNAVPSSGVSNSVDLVCSDAVVSSSLDINGNADISGTLTVGASGTGRDVVLHGDLAGEYFHWDENVSTVNIYHRDELPGLEVYVNGAAQTTQPQLKVGRSHLQYWGAYVDDRNAHLVHRQDETSGIMTTRFDQWDSNTSDTTGHWLWRFGGGDGSNMDTALTLKQNGDMYMRATAALYMDNGGDTYIQESAANQLVFATGGTIALTLDSSQNATFAGSVTATDYRSGSHVYLSSADSWIFRSASGNHQRFQVTSSGDVRLNATTKLYLDGGGNTYITESSADNIKFFTGGTEALLLDSSQNATFAGDVTVEGILNMHDSSADLAIQGDSNGNAYYINSTGKHMFRANGSGFNSMEISSTSIALKENTTITGTLTVGADDTGHDVIFYGATSGKKMQWDESADTLVVDGTLDINGNADISGALTLGTVLAAAEGGTGLSSISTLLNSNVTTTTLGAVKGTHKVWTSVVSDPGTDAWYHIFRCTESASMPVECHLRAYAHTSISFIVSEGYQGGEAHINILDAHRSSANSGYKYVKGVRINSLGDVEVLLNSGSNVQVEMTVIGDAVVPSTLAVTAVSNPTIKDSVTTLSNGMIRAYGQITGAELEGTSLDINGNADISGNITANGNITGDHATNIGAINKISTKEIELNNDSSNSTLTIANIANSTVRIGKLDTETAGTNNDDGTNVVVENHLTVEGKLTVKGDVVTESTSNTVIKDNIIQLNGAVEGASPSANTSDIGVVMDRGTSNSVALQWDESVGVFQLVATGSDAGSASLGVIAGGGDNNDENVAGTANAAGYQTLYAGKFRAVGSAGTSGFTGDGSALTALNGSEITSGTVAVTRGGTGLTSISTLLNSNVTSVSGSSGSCTGNAATATAFSTTLGLTTVSMTFQLAANTWTDTGINSSDLATGTYAMQVFVDDHNAGGLHFDEYYSATISWYGGITNSTNHDEIVTHNAGHASNSSHLQFRTLRHTNPGDNLMLQVKQNFAHSLALNGTNGKTMTFKFRRLI